MSKRLLPDAVEVGDLVFTSGMTGEPGDTETQIRNTIAKLRAALEAHGSSLENVIKGNVYLTDLNDRERYLNRVWKETFGEKSPARTCVQAGLAPGIAVEIEFIAVAKSKKV